MLPRLANRLVFGAFVFVNIIKLGTANNALTEILALDFDHFHQANTLSVSVAADFDAAFGREYNDSRCIQQFSHLKLAYSESEKWAIEGEIMFKMLKKQMIDNLYARHKTFHFE